MADSQITPQQKILNTWVGTLQSGDNVAGSLLVARFGVIVAQITSDKNLEKTMRKELTGYSPRDKVPSYRKLNGGTVVVREGLADILQLFRRVKNKEEAYVKINGQLMKFKSLNRAFSRFMDDNSGKVGAMLNSLMGGVDSGLPQIQISDEQMKQLKELGVSV